MLPPNFTWLEQVGPLPKMVEAAIQYLGIREIPGKGSNPIIIEMAKSLGVDDIYTDDDLSWCALFLNYLIKITGKPPVDIKGDKWNYLRALWLANWGNPVPRGQEKCGDVVILKRDGGGHDCLWIAETPNGFIGLGGNQSNSVRFSEFDSNRIVAVRNYYSITPPDSAKHYKVDSLGNLSTNEA